MSGFLVVLILAISGVSMLNDGMSWQNVGTPNGRNLSIGGAVLFAASLALIVLGAQ